MLGSHCHLCILLSPLLLRVCCYPRQQSFFFPMAPLSLCPPLSDGGEGRSRISQWFNGEDWRYCLCLAVLVAWKKKKKDGGFVCPEACAFLPGA